VEPVSVIFADNITPELDNVLRGVEILPRGDGPFPTCVPAPGQENFYLIVESTDEGQRRFAELNGCSLGYGFPNESGFFQQPIAGLVSTS